MYMDIEQVVKVRDVIKVFIIVFLAISIGLVLFELLSYEKSFRLVKPIKGEEIVYSEIDGIIIDLDYDNGVIFSKPISVRIYADYTEAGMRFVVIKPLKKGFTFKLR